MQNRYSSLTASDFGQLEKVVEMDMIYPKIRAEFYVRLFSLLGEKGSTMYEGYEFFINDSSSNKKFTLALTGFGLGYFAEQKTEEIAEVIGEFNTFLFSDFKNLKECKFEFEHDYGSTILGYSNGEVFEIDNE